MALLPLALAVICFICVGCTGATPPPPPIEEILHQTRAKPPHIVFIVADDLGWNDVGWHNPDMITPNLNRLAMEGVRMNFSYVQPLCGPSRSCFMSGYYPYHTGLQHGNIFRYRPIGLPTDLTTLPQELKKLGYTTHMVGKWHLGFCKWEYTPTYRGFDSFMGYYSCAEDYYTHFHGGAYDFRFNTSVYIPPEREYSTHTFTKRAIDIISAVDPGNEPLFLYLPFQAVHGPIEVPPKYEDMYPHGATRRSISGMVSALDEAVGNITKALADKGFMDNLLIVFTTDNGGPVHDNIQGGNQPLRGGKFTLWEGGTRGAAFVYSKTLLKKKGYENNGLLQTTSTVCYEVKVELMKFNRYLWKTMSSLVHAVDWMPTLVSVAGGVIDESMDGMNVWRTISEDEPSPRTEFVYNIDGIEQNAAIRVGDFKLIEGNPGPYSDWYWGPKRTVASEIMLLQKERYQSQPSEESLGVGTRNSTTASEDAKRYQLYNIKDDPEERHDLSAAEPQRLSIMIERLEFFKRSEVTSQNLIAIPDKANPAKFGGAWSPGWC